MTQRLLLALCGVVLLAAAMRGTSGTAPGSTPLTEEETAHYFALFSSTVRRCPLERWREFNEAVRDLDRGDIEREVVDDLFDELIEVLPQVELTWHQGNLTQTAQSAEPLALARGVERFVLVRILNRGAAGTFTARFEGNEASDEMWIPGGVRHSLIVPITSWSIGAGSMDLEIDHVDGFLPAGSDPVLPVPVHVVPPASLSGVVRDADLGNTVPARIWVLGSDGIYRHGHAPHADITTLTEKQVFEVAPELTDRLIYYRQPFFYSGSAGQFDLELPPGNVTVRVERGFEHTIEQRSLNLNAGQVAAIEMESERFLDMRALGWISSETHVHWSINARYQSENHGLLPLVSRAEDVRVVNNLTMRGSHPEDPDFVAPNLFPPGLLYSYPAGYIAYQGEEWRNNGGYGHLNLLNITELVYPIACGPDLMYLLDDQFDWPQPSTIVEQVHAMSNTSSAGGRPGLALAAHGLHGWVIADLVNGLIDGIDQVRADEYYKVLDCGFHVPITVGADHPGRTLGAARTYVGLEQNATLDYGTWVEGIQAGRTFVTSGPLLQFDAVIGSEEAGPGDELHVASTDTLTLHAEAVARERHEHRIGRLQIVSNGDVVAEKTINGYSGETTVELPVGESRWIVARTTPPGESALAPLEYLGVSHTSAIFVYADGDTRVVADPAQLVAFRDVCVMLADQVLHETVLELEFPWQRVAIEAYLREAAQAYEDLIAQFPGE